MEQRLVVETRQGSELEDSMRSTEELLEREQRYGSLLETEKAKPAGTTNKVCSLPPLFLVLPSLINSVSLILIRL